MDLKQLQEFLGIRPDINTDYTDKSQMTEELIAIYSLINNNKLYDKPSKLSKSFYIAQEYERLLKKQERVMLTEEENNLLAYLKSIMNGI